MMTSNEIRQKFIDFFAKRGHVNLPAANLIPENDPTVLFTTAGMQQFKDYYIFPEKSPATKVTSVQPCFRTSDIEEVGDDSHLTLLEMLGNFSFGDYFKEEAISWAWEFITEELKIDPKRIFVTVFRGDKTVALDDESIRIWRNIGVRDCAIKTGDRTDNFWGPTGAEGPCGPTTEIYVAPTEALAKVGDGYEVWNLVFNEFYQDKNGKLARLAKPGVDTGLGFERLVAVLQGKKSVYDTDLFSKVYQKVGELSSKKNLQSQRIVAEHARAIAFLLAQGILPSNKEQGYVVRRLIRRLILHSRILGIPDKNNQQFIANFISDLGDIYTELKDNRAKILEVFVSEEDRFLKTLDLGIKRLEKVFATNPEEISGAEAFLLYDSYGFPLELTQELASDKKIKVDSSSFQKMLESQRERSRTSQKGFYKGGLAGMSEIETKYHTATHLLHAALRRVLNDHVQQKGSNINPERLRFDFSHPQALTQEEIKKVEDLVNKQIKAKLPVSCAEMELEDAKAQGALAFFSQKYSDKVKVYTIGSPSTLKNRSGSPFSREVCGGPHVKNTSELGHFKIISEKSSSSGIRRIKAILK